MVPLSTLLSRTRTRYEAESGGSSTRWSDAELTLFINEGLESLAEATGFYERYCTIPVRPGQTYYDLRGFTNETVVGIRAVWSTVFNDWLTPRGPEAFVPDWETNSGGTPYFYFTRGVHWLGIHPQASTDATGYLRVHFAGIPNRFGFAQQVLGDLPDNYTVALEDYALYELAALDRQPKRSIQHFKEYMAREKALAEQLDRRLVANTTGRFGRMGGRF